jgi:hypothetical protein
MTKAAQIRALAAEGFTTSQIADQVGVRYQHAYNVLKRCDLLGSAPRKPNSVQPRVRKTPRKRPPLTVALLEEGGFSRVGAWTVTEASLVQGADFPKERGVYAFVKEGTALYVGLATKGIVQRFRSYCRPGKSQRTSKRLNAALIEALSVGNVIDVYTAHPPDLTWNGMPVSGDAGLELGLIQNFDLPWNIRGVGR